MRDISINLWLVTFVIFIGILVTGSLLIATVHMGLGLIWLLITIVAIYLLIASEKNSKEILEERYARGEISRKHYLRMH